MYKNPLEVFSYLCALEMSLHSSSRSLRFCFQVTKDRELNNLNNITRLLACLLRCAKAYIRKVCNHQRALNTNQNPSQFLFKLFRPRSKDTKENLWLKFIFVSWWRKCFAIKYNN